MAVCALTMLDGMEEEVTAAGGVLLLVLALILAWLSTHVADRGDHILGTILTVGAHASLIGLGGHDSYGGVVGGSSGADAPREQQAPAPSQENKPDDGEGPGSERGGGEGGEGAEGVRTDLLLDIQSKQPQAGGGLNASDEEEEEEDEVEEEEEEEEEEELEEEEEEDKEVIKPLAALTDSIITTTIDSITMDTTSISVRLKFLNDTEEVAVVEPEDTVGILKSKYFSGREHQIKLIYQGQLLQDPDKTLSALNITHNSVIHCHVSQLLQEAGGGGPEEGGAQGGGVGAGGGGVVSGGIRAAGVAISTSSLVVPVFVVVLAVVWYFRINYRQFFTAPATISLMGVTVFFSFLIFGMHSR